MTDPKAIKPCYLICGDDETKIARALARLRERASDEGGSLETFDPQGPRRGPDAAEVAGALAAMSLHPGHRYLIAEGAEGWLKADLETIVESLSSIPPETTLVIVARGKTPKALVKPVEKAGGQVLEFDAPADRELPRWVVGEASSLGLEISLDAARVLVDRMGPRQLRLRNELERLALWAGGEAEIDVEDLEAMISDETELAIWSLGDALAEGNLAAATAAADRLLAQGEPIQKVIATVAPRVRAAHAAAAALEQGRPPGEVAGGMKMHPYAAKQLVAKVSGRDPEELARAVEAIADLELASRGGAVSDEVALAVAVRQACGAVSAPAADPLAPVA